MDVPRSTLTRRYSIYFQPQDTALLASIASGGLGRWVELDDHAGRTTRAYVKDEDCVACLKDLQNFFRHDDAEYRHAFFAIHKYNFAKTDLVPLLVTYPDDYEVVYNTLKVCTHLTMHSAEISKGLVHRQFEAMRTVVEAFIGGDGSDSNTNNALEVVMTLLAEPLSKHPKMKDRDASLVELVVIFLRNLLASVKITQQEASYTVRESARVVHGDLLRGFQRADVTELLVTIAQHARERPFRSQASLLLEIFLNVFQFSPPEQLVDVPSVESVVARNAALASSRDASAEVRARNKKKAYQSAPQLPSAGANRTVTRFGPARQQFAGAVFMRRHKDHTQDVLVRHTPAAQELPGMSQASNTRQAKSQRMKQYYMNDAEDGDGEPSGMDSYATLSERDVRLLHWKKDLLDKFLSDAYTPLVGQVFKEAKPGLDISRMEEDEFERFVRFVAFCTKYVRLGEERKLVARLKNSEAKRDGTNHVKDDATGGNTGEGTDKWVEGMDKGAEGTDSASMSPFACISSTMGWDAFHMVQVLFLISVEREVQKAKDKNQPYRSHVLLYSLGPLLREMLMTLDLARIAGNEADRQAADRLQRKLLHNDDRTGMLQVLTTLIREYKFHLHPRSHAVHLAEILHVVLATLDRLTNQGSFQVAKEVKQRKKSKKKKAASGADGGGVGQVDGPVASAAPAAGDAQAADSADGADGAGGADGNDSHVAKSSPAKAADDADADADAAESDEEARYVTLEHDFDPQRRLRAACAHPQIILFYVWLLQGYKKNSYLTNDAIISFLERLAGPAPRGMGLHCMLWQLSVVRTFHAIMSDNCVHKDPKFKRLLKLCIFVIRGLFERLCPDLSELEKKRDEAATKQKDLEQELEDLRLVHLGEDDVVVEPKLAAVRKDIEQAKVAAHEAAVEIKMKEEVASLAFVELLFGKHATVAESIANEYNWKTHVSMMADAPEGAVQVGFASFRARKAGEFTEEQSQMLLDYFEQCNGRKDCLSYLVFEFGGAFKKVHISRKLKELGLEKGKLTPRQRDMLFILAERYAEKPSTERYETIREQLGGGFTAGQVKTHMKKLGLVKGADKSKKKSRRDSEMSDVVSDDDSLEFDTDDSASEASAASSDEASDQIDAGKAFDAMLADMDVEHGDSDQGASLSARPSPRPSRLAAMKDVSPLPASPSASPTVTNKRAKDLTEEEAEAARAEAKRRALELLRRRHGTHAAEASAGPDPENVNEDATENATENVPTEPTDPSSPVKTFGRRLIKKSAVVETQQSQMGGSGGGASFDDLMDF